MTLTFDLVTPKVDSFISLPRRPPIYSKISSFILKTLRSQDW